MFMGYTFAFPHAYYAQHAKFDVIIMYTSIVIFFIMLFLNLVGVLYFYHQLFCLMSLPKFVRSYIICLYMT